MTVVHLVYPHSKRLGSPDAIGRNLGEHLEQYYQVKYYDWDADKQIEPGAEDILIGHPHPSPHTCFRLNYRKPGWRRVLVMCPFNTDPDQVAFLDRFIRYSHKYLAITGNYWFSKIEASSFAHWRPKMVHLDLAINRKDFVPLERNFNDPGKRRFVYIGNTAWCKNTDYLCKIAQNMPGTQFSWIGSGNKGIRSLKPYGFQDFSRDEARQILREQDFMITVGKADANPTTILEAMAWGLIPVCTPQSGYINWPGILNIPLNDVAAAVNCLNHLEKISTHELEAIRQNNWKKLDDYFNWDRFSGQVMNEISAEDNPPTTKIRPKDRLILNFSELTSHYSPLNPLRLARFLRTYWRSLLSH